MKMETYDQKGNKNRKKNTMGGILQSQQSFLVRPKIYRSMSHAEQVSWLSLPLSPSPPLPPLILTIRWGMYADKDH